MTPKRARVIELKEQGYSRNEIAEAMGLSISGVKRHLERGSGYLSLKQEAACDRMGIPRSQLSHGWTKEDTGSFFFKVPKRDVNHDEYVDAIKDALKGNVGKSVRTKAVQCDSDLLTRYVLADLHFGMLSWGEQSGQDYDVNIASRYLHDAMEELIETTPKSDTALILNLGDTFHANDSKNKTPMSGHLLDVDGRFPKIALATVKAIRNCIDMALKRHKHVIYAGIQGNHDPDQSHWLNIALMMHYEGNPRVDVKWNPSEFFAMRWGRNGIYAHHGDKAKFERLHTYITDTYRKIWGDTYWSSCDTGHIHHLKEQDIGGIVFRAHRTIAAKDAYAVGHAYSGRQTLSAIVTHKDRGEIMKTNVNIYPEARNE